MSILVTIATFKQANTAYFLKEKLEKEKIECFFTKRRSTEGPWGEVSVQVRDFAVEKAIKIMLGIREEYGKDIDQIEPANLTRKILVPTDFSVGSEYACQYAIHLAKRIKGEIKLLHVFENPVINLGIKETATYQDYLQTSLAETERRAHQQILDFSQRMKVYMDTMNIQDVRIHSSLVMGGILAGIKDMAGIYMPDFIVLGTVSSSGKSESVFGGLADALIHGLDIPLYAISGPCSRKDFEKVNILYATDFNEKDHDSLERLLNIVEPFDKKISCIHIDTAQSPAKSERMDELNVQLKKEYGQYDIQCMLIEDRNVFHGIESFAGSYNINLLSFTVHKRGIFEKLFKPNLFKKILQESNLPILLFPS